ncbi:MAG TPA: hypothetical protein VJ809_01015, partial [Pirellulales bacterium]|nr:hypothetical protein [Pirellulales bacterium]
MSCRFVTLSVVAALALGVLGCSSGASVRRPIARTSSQTHAPPFVASEQVAGPTSGAVRTEAAETASLPIAAEPTPDRAIQTVQHNYPVEPEANPP